MNNPVTQSRGEAPQDGAGAGLRIWDVLVEHDGRPVNKLRVYLPAYERYFSRFAGTPLTFMEIGIGQGGSLQLWKEYFGPRARIVGLDIREEVREFEEDQIDIRIGDQADPRFLAGLIEEFGPPDIVLDDGSHRMRDVRRTFNYMYPRMSPTGVYMVEDMQTSYWEQYGGGLRTRGTFIERAKTLIDELNAHHVRNARFGPTEFTETTAAIHFHDAIVVFERGEIGGRMIPARVEAGPPLTNY